MAVLKSEIEKVVRDSLNVAIPAIDSIRIEGKRAAAKMVDQLPRYAQLRLGTAEVAWAAILFVDLRGSTERATRVRARGTYIAMHALLPTLAYLTGANGGYIVGFRGDGLFSAFGLTADGTNLTNITSSRDVQNAAVCGDMMIEAVRTVVNPILEEFHTEGALQIGVGIDYGEIVITRIGLTDGHETTAYGDAVNIAAKLSNSYGILLSENAFQLFPRSDTGQVTFDTGSSSGRHGFRPKFPASNLI